MRCRRVGGTQGGRGSLGCAASAPILPGSAVCWKHQAPAESSYLEICSEDTRDLLGADTKQKLEVRWARCVLMKCFISSFHDLQKCNKGLCLKPECQNVKLHEEYES